MKRMLVLFVLMCGGSSAAVSQDLYKQAARNMSSVVLIQIGPTDGTGFVISHDPPLIATNAHVAMQGKQPSDITVRLNESGTPLKVQAIHLHKGYDTKRSSKETYGPDVALLELEAGTTGLGPPLPLLSATSPTDIRGREVVLIGYPVYATFTGERDSAEAAVRYGTVQRLIDYDGGTSSSLAKRPLMEHFPAVTPGESGSPLISLDTGVVIGIHNGTKTFRRKGTTEVLATVPVAVHTRILWEVIEQANLTKAVRSAE